MIRVLIVDDDFMVARVHTGFVARIDGFEVVGARHTGAEAVTAVAELQPDLVLLDLYLPDHFGLEVVTLLRAAGETCDVMIISAAKELDAVRGAGRLGVVDYLLKPFGFDDLRQRLTRYATARSRAEAASVHSQDDVDRVLGARSSSVPPSMPKGLSAPTAVLVEGALRGQPDTLSAQECAELVGLSRVSARRYLEHFCDTGQAEVRLRYGATGRPERRYRWAT